MGLFSTGNCPICEEKTKTFKKTLCMYNGESICRECLNSILNKGINILSINDYSLTELRKMIEISIYNSYDNEKNSKLKNGFVQIEEIKLIDENINNIKEKFIAFDVETTGLNSYTDKIVEIGAVIFENGKLISKFGSLVNCEQSISPGASRVNNITNEMIKAAPSEKEVYNQFFNFIKNEFPEDIIICAHNASFDMGFLKNTLNRLGYNCNIKYVDTLKLSRKSIYNIDNHKLSTLANYFNLINPNEHRAYDDAKICGEILLKLIPYVERKNEQISKKKGRQIFSDLELLICSYIKKSIIESNMNIDYLRFEKNSENYICCKSFYEFLKFKVTIKGVFFIIENKYAKKIDLIKDNAILSEGGIEKSRVYIDNIKNIDEFFDYILKEYKKAYDYTIRYIDGKDYKINQVNELISIMLDISLEQMNENINNTTKISFPNISVKVTDNIDRKLIKINPVNSRTSIEFIKNKMINTDEIYNDSEQYYKEIERLRKICNKSNEYEKIKDYDNAILYLDKARSEGFLTGDLYRSYIKIFNVQKDYDNEIDIIEEAIPIMKKNGEYISDLMTKLQNAINSKYKEINKNNLSKAKEEEKAIKKLEKENEKTIKKAEKVFNTKASIEGRHIIQMNDDNSIIKEYISIAEAVRETGINSKSIRDAAKGVQKHAGGYVWKYQE